MTSRHLLRGATKRGVFLGGDKNESDRASDEMLTFLSPRPIENHDPCSKLRRKTTTKTKKSRDTIVVAFVFLLTYYLSFSWTTTSGGRVHNTSVSSERALELRAKYAKLAKAEKERALKLYGYHGGGHLLGGNHIGHHLLEYSSPLPESSSSSSSYGIGAFERVTRKMLAMFDVHVTGQTDYVTPSATTCGSTGSYTVPGADTAGEFGGRMCCSTYYATAVTYCGATEDTPSFEYEMYVTAGENSQTSISSGATSTGSGDCKTYDTAANPAKICVLSVCKSTDTSDCAFTHHSVTFTHAPFPPPSSPPPPSPPPPAQAAVEVEMQLTGYSAAEFGETQKTAFKNGMALYLGVSSNAITVTNVVDVSARRKLQAATDKVKVEFTVETTTYADILTVEEKLVTTDNTKLTEIVNTLNDQDNLVVTEVIAPTSLMKLAPPPSPPPDSQILSSGTAKVWSVWVGSVVSLAVAVALTIVV